MLTVRAWFQMASFSTRRPLGFALLLAMLAGPALRGADLIALPALGLRVERGFRVTLFADSDLANDIYAMTLDPRGNVVVTSQGYIRTLYDRDNDGVADAATDFAITRTGCMGLCFDGTDLWFVGDGGLFRFSDRNADGVADGPPEQLLPLAGGEHGAHAIRKGPDGSWYLIGGNDTGFGSRHATLPSSPVSTSEAGALLRLTPDGRSSEIIAQGFRNPYDFDFNFAGDLFTYDSDVEADFFLPWYTPTRVYHVGHAGHHGWRLKGHQRSWNRPGYYADTVDVLAPIGRGSPTGVACYRHYQFPPYYHGGLFALDWTFGKVYFLPLEIAGAGYRAPPEVFLESIGTHGFAPTDAVVAPDGSLLVSIGGRKTCGAVYRIQYIADIGRVVTATNWLELSTTGVEAALAAPQPLEAWSRAVWVPLAQRLGPELFETAAAEETLLPETRTRAIEIVTEVHGGLSTGAAQRLARASLPLVRARVAWSLGRVPCSNYQPILLGLARDSAPLARRFALEAIGDRSGDFDPAALRQALGANLAHPEKRIRQAAARLALTLPEPDWNALWEQTAKADAQSRLTVILARLWRTSREEIDVAAVDAALAALGQSRLADHRLRRPKSIPPTTPRSRSTDTRRSWGKSAKPPRRCSPPAMRPSIWKRRVCWRWSAPTIPRCRARSFRSSPIGLRPPPTSITSPCCRGSPRRRRPTTRPRSRTPS
jgi:putative membrane-bound dehydrogenase-like protein